jgi:hypothetical protein
VGRLKYNNVTLKGLLNLFLYLRVKLLIVNLSKLTREIQIRKMSLLRYIKSKTGNSVEFYMNDISCNIYVY